MMNITGIASSIKDDEQVILFPTFAFEDNSSWTGHIRGWIYEPEAGSVGNQLAGALETLITELFSLSREDQREAAESRSPFARRAGMFFVDNERAKRLSVTIAGQTVTLGRSEKNGHFEGEVKLPAAAGRPGNWIEVRALTQPGDTRVFAGRMQVIPRTGISVISDIDDTIKHSSEVSAEGWQRRRVLRRPVGVQAWRDQADHGSVPRPPLHSRW